MAAGGGQVLAISALLLWHLLASAYARLGFDALGDETFCSLVLARIIEPTFNAETVWALDVVGVSAPALTTIYRGLQRAQQRGYRGQMARACLAHSARTTGKAVFIMYDVTTLHFENADDDALRKVGMSKEHRVDPQAQVGLLVDPGGFPLEVHLFEGNNSETTTLIAVQTAFQERHGVTDVVVVVVDAGMLSATNLNALEDAGFEFIVGSGLTKAPYDLAEHFERKGNYFTDGQILESTRVMGTGKGARDWRVFYQWALQADQPR